MSRIDVTGTRNTRNNEPVYSVTRDRGSGAIVEEYTRQEISDRVAYLRALIRRADTDMEIYTIESDQGITVTVNLQIVQRERDSMLLELHDLRAAQNLIS